VEFVPKRKRRRAVQWGLKDQKFGNSLNGNLGAGGSGNMILAVGFRTEVIEGSGLTKAASTDDKELRSNMRQKS